MSSLLSSLLLCDRCCVCVCVCVCVWFALRCPKSSPLVASVRRTCCLGVTTRTSAWSAKDDITARTSIPGAGPFLCGCSTVYVRELHFSGGGGGSLCVVSLRFSLALVRCGALCGLWRLAVCGALWLVVLGLWCLLASASSDGCFVRVHQSECQLALAIVLFCPQCFRPTFPAPSPPTKRYVRRKWRRFCHKSCAW